ncbi:MAG: CoA ester lyase [Kordiimonadaceae bacterium]|nr:CoA ester lyase [Kordiimonadaceae bacterium]MBO6567740.1 CoA ester lyase [Kordiimonadaceae bacterium]MBO6963045.1 CoA ester lyase [Kordiimonadaceae bacterium]
MTEAAIRPRRSVLFMPGSNARALEKAKTIDADVLVFDLEDAVAPEAKEEARALVAAALQSGDYGHRELVVRINALGTDWWRADLAAIGPHHPSAVLLPKVESIDTLEKVSDELVWHSSDHSAEFWVMLETPRGFLRAEDIAQSHDRLTTFVIGTNDLVKETRARHVPGREPVLHALSHAILVARAYGLNVLDGVYSNFKDAEGFGAECTQARNMGFDGKTLIHPSQVDAANAAFSASDAEVEEARRMIAAFEAAQAEGKGVAVLDGRMIEELHLSEARRMVALSEYLSAR